MRGFRCFIKKKMKETLFKILFYYLHKTDFFLQKY